MFELFKTKKNHFIGVDVGTSSIKVVELSYKDQKTNLENYGMVDLNFSNQKQTKSITFEEKMNELLKKLVTKMEVPPMSTCVAIPGFSGLITIIELPDMQEAELAKAIQFEAHKYIPSSLDEIAMSWEVVERIADPKADPKAKVGGKIKVLLVAAPKKEIEYYDRMVANSGLEVSAIELETFSIVRSLVGEDQGTFLIVDIGSRATNIILVEKGIIQVNRNIDAGGNEITTAIADGMNISRQRAESFKKGDKDMLNNNESAIVIPVLELIIGESRRIIAAYKSKNAGANIDALILSGGTSKMKGMEEYFTRSLSEKVKMGNPWRSITVENKAATFTKELGSSFAVVLGLALRGIEDYKRK